MQTQTQRYLHESHSRAIDGILFTEPAIENTAVRNLQSHWKAAIATKATNNRIESNRIESNRIELN
jgi:hypothetical protein